MRKKKAGSRDTLRAYLIEHVGEVLDSETLRSIANVSEWARRIRELRNEEGMNIVTHNDRSGMKPGQYMLEDLKPLPAFARTISKEVRASVLDRNGFTCQMCGAVAGDRHPYDPARRTRLHIGHSIDKSQGGTDDPGNLRAICSVCNEGASNITSDRPSAMKLLVQIRRAPTHEQLEVMRWLIRKFPTHVGECLAGPEGCE